MPNNTEPAANLLWSHDMTQTKFRKLLEDPVVDAHLAAVDAHLRNTFFEAGFRIGGLHEELDSRLTVAGSRRGFEMLDIPRGARLMLMHAITVDYLGVVRAEIALNTWDPPDSTNLLTLQRDAFKLNWQVARTEDGKYRREDLMNQLRDQEFFEKDVTLPPAWTACLLDILEP